MYRLLTTKIDTMILWFGAFFGSIIAPENINVYVENGVSILCTATGVVLGNYFLRFIKQYFK